LITTVPVTGRPAGIGVHTGTGNVYVATDANLVVVLDATGVLVTNIGPAGFSSPQDVTVDSVANRAYVVNNANNTLTVINTLTNTVVSTFTVGAAPIGVAVNPARNRATSRTREPGSLS
jgi:YVTN family beta-propeller protein